MTDFITPEVYGPLHFKYMFMGFAIWVIVPFIGKKLMSKSQQRITVFILILLTLGQEIINDTSLMLQGLWRLSDDLALHMCGFSLFLTSWALFSKKQSAFELAYFWGIAGATQAILTPELSGIWNPLGIFVYFFSHSMIILNVIWMMVVEGMRLRKSSLLNAIFITNGFCFIMTIVNQLVNGNYWYLCTKPLVNSPFLIGEWPFYLIGIQIAGMIMMGIIYLPWLPYFRRMALQSKSTTA